jgi:Flp pilus assembly pilin Flp
MRRQAQSTLEFALLVVAVAAALIAMDIYLKRGIQGKLRQSADELGQQYAPGNTSSSITTETSGHVITNVYSDTVGNRTETTTITNILSESEKRSGTETVSPE